MWRSRLRVSRSALDTDRERQTQRSAPTPKLDRLSRNVAFISNLMESGVEFVAADMPMANRLTVHAGRRPRHEREMISRTKAALAAAKARGVKLGNPNGGASAGRAPGRRRGQGKAYRGSM